MTRLLALLGFDRRIARVRETVNEGVMAAEDRVQLLRMAWDDEKLRLRRMVLLLIALVGLTLMMTSLLSMAVIVHFWDTPHRATAAWLVALTWLLLWAIAVWMLLSTLKNTPASVEAAREELSRDREWLQQRFGDDDDDTPKVRPATRQELVDRIEGQRRRLMLQDRMEAMAEEMPEPESTTEKAMRVASEHPMAVGAAAAVVVAVLGPRRLLKTASLILPILWKFR